ncbi:MAG: peptidoglycan-associated lipoprotein Pal [Verrucomicrobiota bacterium]
MKSVNFFSLLVVVLALTVGVAGCKKTPKGVTSIPGLPSTVPGADQTGGPVKPPGPDQSGKLPEDSGVKPANVTPEGTIPLSARPDGMFPDREVFKQQTVYFDFDRSAVKPGEKAKIEAVAAHLKNETANKVEIEGHCDERGTEEYNRALGERRALAVREYLVNLGIAADRISTVSFGEDKAAVEGHDEAAWAKNRRGEFVLLKPKP